MAAASPPAAVSIEPVNGTFEAKGSLSVHTLSSNVDQKLAFKIKCSNNELYRVKPVYGFLERGKTVNVEILRLLGPAKDDKLVIQWADVPNDESDPIGPFKAGAQSGEITFPMKAT